MRALLSLLAVLTAGVARAQERTVVSPGPDSVAVTVYRAPYGRGALDLRYLQGFALVTETRRVALPRGRATLRFEGVAEGIVPVSAIVDGLPGGTIEKNRDARLLSPASLVDGTLGRQVTLTRTDPATGRSVSEDATIVAGPANGVVLRTHAGIEALGCAGLPEHIRYAGVPAGLSAKPVLSVTTTTRTARVATVRLSYLASGFDWRASYVATMAADGRTLDLFAWLTLANGNAEAFASAQVQAVAGRLNRVAVAPIPYAAAGLRLSCYPLGTTTSDLRLVRVPASADIVVTGTRLMAGMIAPPPPPPVGAPPAPPAPENLGDLKLYRVPERVTVAANEQIQVALLKRSNVRFTRVYRRRIDPNWRSEGSPTAIVLKLRNDRAQGLGIPLPAGDTALYAGQGDRRLLLGLGAMTDRTTGETIRLAAGISRQVQVSQTQAADGRSVLRVTNANPFAVALELPIGEVGRRIETGQVRVERVDGVATWTPILAPNGSAELRYRDGA